MSQSVKTSASIATSPTTSTFCCYIFSSHLLTSPHHWNIMEYLWLDTWWHESTSKLPHLRPKGPSVPSKLVQVPWHMKSSDGSKSLASQCISMQHVQTLLMEYSWNSVCAGQRSLTAEVSESVQRFRDVPTLSCAVVCWHLFRSRFLLQPESERENSVARNRLNRYPLDVHLPSFGAFWLAAPWGFCQQWTSQPFHGTSAIAATSAWALLHDPTAAQQLSKCLNCPPAIKDFK